MKLSELSKQIADYIAENGDAEFKTIDGKATELDFETLAANDGLTLLDWEAWFKGGDKSRPMAVIHFTSFRYCK